MKLHFSANQKIENGVDIVTPENSPLRCVSFGLNRIGEGQEISIDSGSNEIVIVLLNGFCEISSGKFKGEKLSRESVFKEKASAIYLPPNRAITLRAHVGTEVAVAKAPCGLQDLDEVLVRPSDVAVKEVGQKNWFRKVHDIIRPDFPAGRLIVGETYNAPGNWSSSPPHKHDVENPPAESMHEEVYFYRFNPDQGFGVQRVYSEGEFDHSYVVKDNDVVAIPKGYHPVVAGPGYELYYLWVLCGDNRNASWFEDPQHKWIND